MKCCFPWLRAEPISCRYFFFFAFFLPFFTTFFLAAFFAFFFAIRITPSLLATEWP